MRLTTAFTLDSTFDGDGKIDDFDLTAPFDARAVAVQTDGKIVWAGSVEQSLFGVPNVNFLVGRFLANGAPDPTFDGNGYRVVLFDAGGSLADYAEGVAVQADGKVVVVGRAYTGPNSTDFAIARLNVDGSLDTTFSGDGKLLVSFVDDSFDSADSVAIDRFGRIVVAGAADFFHDGVVRLLADGTFDPSFGVGGKTQLTIGSGNGTRSLLLLPGDAILVAGDIDPPGADEMDNYVAMLEPDGDLDLGFGGGDGKVTFGTLPFVADPHTSFKAVAAHAGKILVAGDASTDQPDIGFALRLWMSRIHRDDFETGNLLQWSGSAGN
jgi:uncharacterized delta-60 repeat protein